MKICLLNTCFDAALQTPSDLQSRYLHPRGLAQALMNRGHNVTLIQGFHQTFEMREQGLRICYIRLPAFSHEDKPFARCARAYLPGMPARRRLSHFLSLQEMDALHVFGTSLWPEMWAITSAFRNLSVPISFSYHGGKPPRNPLIRYIQKKSLSRAASIFFPKSDVAHVWQKSGVLSSRTEIRVVPEVSSLFQRHVRENAQKCTGLSGAPIFLWVGRLQKTKDPMTALRAFSKIHKEWPSSKLYFIYYKDDLLSDLKDWLKQNKTLQQAVVFLGCIPNRDMEVIYNSADFFLLTSRSEIGSNTTVEAMACGAIPVTSNLASLAFLLGNGKAGYLFTPGDANACAKIILENGKDHLEERSLAIRKYFDTHLTYDSMANEYEAAWKVREEREE